jgi:hypothetical protein
MGKLALVNLTIEMRSPRGVLETLAVRSHVRVPSIVQVLPHRDPGPLTLPSGPGHKPTNVPLADRKRRLEERGRREAAQSVTNATIPSRSDGSGETMLDLPEGCQRLDLLAETGILPNGHSEDIDMEVSTTPKGDRVAIDRSDNVDASTTFCLGERTPVRVRFVGAKPSSKVTLLKSVWELPQGLPERWGAATRAQMASVIRGDGASVVGQPVYESLGVQGLTSLGIDTRAGACYTAAIVALRGTGIGLHIAARGATSGAENRSGPDEAGTVIAFCATSDRRTLLDVETRGLGLAWLLAVWETGSVKLGEVSP